MRILTAHAIHVATPATSCTSARTNEEIYLHKGMVSVALTSLDYMSRAGPVCRDIGTLVKRNKNQLCDYMTSGPARLAEIPVSRCRDPG